MPTVPYIGPAHREDQQSDPEVAINDIFDAALLLDNRRFR